MIASMIAFMMSILITYYQDLVLCISIGLIAITLIAISVIDSISTKHNTVRYNAYCAY